MSVKDEINEIIDEKLAQIPPIVFPTSFEVSNFPEQKDPVINVTVPEIKVPEPKVTVNVPEAKVMVTVPQIEIPENTSSNEILTEIRDSIKDSPRPTYEEIVFALQESTEKIVEAYKKIKIYGGSGGIASNLYNTQSVVINPATADNQTNGDQITKINVGSSPVSTTNPLPVLSEEFFIEVAKGNVTGHSIQRIIARNTDVDTGEEDIWFTGGTATYLASAERMNVASASGDDTSAGNITFTAQSAATVHATIPAGENRTGKSQFTVPASKTAYLVDFMPSLGAGKVGCDVVFKARPFGEVFRMISRVAVQSTGVSAINHILTMGAPKFTEKTDLKVTATGSANDQDVFVEYILLLVNN